MSGMHVKVAVLAALVLSSALLSGCASFSPDAGFSVVSAATAATDGKETAFVRNPDDASRAQTKVRDVLAPADGGGSRRSDRAPE